MLIKIIPLDKGSIICLYKMWLVWLFPLWHYLLWETKKNKMLQISWNVQISHFQKIDKIAPTSDMGGGPPLPIGAFFFFMPSPSFLSRPSISNNIGLFWDTPITGACIAAHHEVIIPEAFALTRNGFSWC